MQRAVRWFGLEIYVYIYSWGCPCKKLGVSFYEDPWNLGRAVPNGIPTSPRASTDPDDGPRFGPMRPMAAHQLSCLPSPCPRVPGSLPPCCWQWQRRRACCSLLAAGCWLLAVGPRVSLSDTRTTAAFATSHAVMCVTTKLERCLNNRAVHVRLLGILTSPRCARAVIGRWAAARPPCPPHTSDLLDQASIASTTVLKLRTVVRKAYCSHITLVISDMAPTTSHCEAIPLPFPLHSPYTTLVLPPH